MEFKGAGKVKDPPLKQSSLFRRYWMEQNIYPRLFLLSCDVESCGLSQSHTITGHL